MYFTPNLTYSGKFTVNIYPLSDVKFSHTWDYLMYSTDNILQLELYSTIAWFVYYWEYSTSGGVLYNRMIYILVGSAPYILLNILVALAVKCNGKDMGYWLGRMKIMLLDVVENIFLMPSTCLKYAHRRSMQITMHHSYIHFYCAAVCLDRCTIIWVVLCRSRRWIGLCIMIWYSSIEASSEYACAVYVWICYSMR